MNTTLKLTSALMPLASRRRLVATGAAGLLITFAAVFMQATNTFGVASNVVSGVGLVLMVFGWARFMLPNYSGLPQPGQTDLDERQQQVVTHAYASSYRFLAFGVVALGLYMMFTDVFPTLPTLNQPFDKSLLLLALTWTVMGLPSAVLAWNEPDAME